MTTQEDREAYARLIAAAPDLLGAAKRMVYAYERANTTNLSQGALMEIGDALDALETAVSRAGEQA